LFHFSDDPSIRRFDPRPVRVPATRPEGFDWLNGPLVWAIDDWHQPMYYFPRDCPRILLWPTPSTTDADRSRLFGQSRARMLAFVEADWMPALERAQIHRYEFAPEAFVALDDAGMWVSRTAVEPLDCTRLDDLPGHLRTADVELRVLAELTPLRDVWSTSLHASGIRLRNARGWT